MQLSDSVYSEALKKEWQDLKNVTPNTLVKINDPFFCLIYARIAVCLENQKKYAESFEAYRLAYAFSALKTDSMLMLESMLACLGKMDRKTDAAMLALKEYELFYSNAITEPVRFKFADILIHGNMSKEAVNILAKDLNDPNVSAGKKQRIFWKSLDMLLNRKLYFDANSFVKIVYPDKKSYENMEALKKIQIASGNFKNALEFCRKIAVSYPEFQLKNYREAVDLAYSLKDYTNLISFADLILKENPEDSVLFLRAVAYEELGKVEQAEHDYLAFINYAKRDDTSDSLAQAYYRVGRLMMMSGQDTVEAIPYFLLLFERFPDHSLAPATGYWLTHLYLEADDTGRVYAVIDNMKKRYAKNRFTGSAIFK